MSRSFLHLIRVCCLVLCSFYGGSFSTLFAQQSNITCSTFFGGSKFEYVINSQVVNGNTYAFGFTRSPDLAVTNGTQLESSGLSFFVAKFDAQCQLMKVTYLPFNGDSGGSGMVVENGVIHFASIANANNLPVTNGSTLQGISDWAYFKLDTTNLAIQYGTYLGGSGVEGQFLFQAQNGAAYFWGFTGSANYPVTDGSTLSSNGYDYALTKIAANGTIAYAKYIGAFSEDGSTGDFKVVNDEAYAAVRIDDKVPYWTNTTDGSTTYLGNGGTNTMVIKVGTTGNLVYSKRVIADVFLAVDEGANSKIAISNGTLSIVGNVNVNDLIGSTDGSTFPSGVGLAFVRLGSTGNVMYKTFFDGDLYEYSLQINARHTFIATNTPNGTLVKKISNNNPVLAYNSTFGNQLDYAYKSFLDPLGNLYVLGDTRNVNFPVTNGSTLRTGLYNNSDVSFVKLDTTGSIAYATFLGGNGRDEIFVGGADFTVLGNTVYLTKGIGMYGGVANTFPVTDPNSLLPTENGNEQIAIVKLNLCPTFPTIASDPVTPASQVVCQNGLIDPLMGTAILISGDSLPIIYRGGIAETQPNIEAEYQWQTAPSASGPWTDIAGAQQQNYSPQPIFSDRYFRRLAKQGSSCGGGVVSTSSIAQIKINTFVAPNVDAGGVFNTCPDVPVVLNATVTGGATPYSYDWDMNAADMEDPTVMVSQSSVFTLYVTDANGCRQLDQAIVNTYQANAGPATANACAGQSVRIGGTPIAGLSGVTYAWSPSTALSCTNCAQPSALPLASTVYTLSVTIPITGTNNVCTTTDDITVAPIAAPRPNFAGADVTICKGGTASLGTPAETGFTYTWAPGNYLTDNHVAQTTFQPGSYGIYPYPFKYYLTAQQAGCTFVDSAFAYVIQADAWIDGCGPRTVGVSDVTPDISETYEWVKISGPGSITGATNTAQTTVSASVGGTTEYELRVSYNGITCTDRVLVPEPCECNVYVNISAPNGCPSFGLNNGIVNLYAYGVSSPSVPSSSYIYTWTVVAGPAGGLDTYSGYHVRLTDDLSRTYRVTLTSSLNPSFSCFYDIAVNASAWSLPVFQSPDVSTCVDAPVQIGQPPVADYSYNWYPWAGLSNKQASNPVATVNQTTTFDVYVRDNRSGCSTRDTVVVQTLNTKANAGSDILICNNATVALGGTQNYPNSTIQWTPVNANYQNGTSANSARPQVLVAANQQFILTVTSNVGNCVSLDTVEVRVGTPITSFSLPSISYCPSNGAVQLGSTTPAGFTSYSWSPSALIEPASGGTGGANAASPTTTATPPNSPTTFRLTVRNATGCEYATTQLITPTVIAPNAGSNRIICLGDNVQLGKSSNPTGAGISYTWTGAAVAQLSNTSSTTPAFTPTAVGDYTFTLTKNDNGCNSTATVTVKVNSFTLPDIAPLTICAGTSQVIGTTAQQGVQYFWTPTTNLSDATIAAPTVSGLTETTSYTLTAIGTNGCPAVATVVVGINDVPAPTVTIAPQTICTRDNSTHFNPMVTPSATYTYLWSPNDGTISDIYASNPQILVFIAGQKTYTVTVTNANTGCASTQTTVLTVENCPLPCSITATFTQNECNNNRTTASSSDDYFTVTITAASATNGGTNGKYEVLYNNTVLNVGGTLYGTNVTVGNDGIFLSDGSSTYQFTVRDLDIPTCTTSVFTTTASAACSTIPCPTPVCLPVMVTRSTGNN
jgi:hypothetical protein